MNPKVASVEEVADIVASQLAEASLGNYLGLHPMGEPEHYLAITETEPRRRLLRAGDNESMRDIPLPWVQHVILIQPLSGRRHEKVQHKIFFRPRSITEEDTLFSAQVHKPYLPNVYENCAPCGQSFQQNPWGGEVSKAIANESIPEFIRRFWESAFTSGTWGNYITNEWVPNEVVSPARSEMDENTYRPLAFMEKLSVDDVLSCDYPAYTTLIHAASGTKPLDA